MDTVDGGAGEDTGEAETISAQSLYATLGLSSEDVDALAQIPESEISVETLPYLIMQLKAKRANKESASADTDYRDKSRISQDKLSTPERCAGDRRRSPLSSSSARRSRSHGSHEHEHHGKGEGHRKVERYTGGRRDLGYRKSSREKQSGDHVAVETEPDVNPTVFPHKCSLCKCVLNSIKTWRDHLSGVRHKLRESERSSRSFPPPKRPYSSDPVIGDQYMSTSSDHLYPPKPNTRVVVAKFPMGAVAVGELLELGKPFGTIVKHLVFPAKGFLEFESPKEAQTMVSHFKQKPAFIKENAVFLYLSPTVEGIYVREGVEAEVLELAGMFGEVWQSKFADCKGMRLLIYIYLSVFAQIIRDPASLTAEALIEMVDWRDADIMVKYYHSNPLRIQGKSIKVTMSHISSLRENSPEPVTRKSDSSKYSRQREESTSSNKDKSDSSNQENTEKDDKLMGKEDKVLDDEEGIQLEDEPGLLDEGTDDTVVKTEEEEKKEDEEKMEEEKPNAAEEENRERGSEQNQEEEGDLDDAEFPENIEDFVTLDELDNNAGDSTLPKDCKVVVVWPVKKTPDFMKDLYSLSAPFGSVVKHSLSTFKQEAMIELETAEKAQEMVQFYSDHKATICGRPVSVSMCLTMKTIESPSGRSVFISCLPNQRYRRQKYTHKSLFKLTKPFGRVTGYSLHRYQGTCYMQLESTKAAERMVALYTRRPCKFWGSVLKVAMCRKGDSLIRWRHPDSAEEREIKKEIKEIKPSTERTENEQNQHSSLPNCEGVGGDPVCESKGSEEDNQLDKTPLNPYQPDQTVGVNYVIPVTGFFCKLCNIFYTDENRAKSEHCRSLEHYNNLKLKHAEVVEETDGHPDG
ncbi:Matrin-3 [Labeo rohita]|uniref:Matrin-3 n=1 Tax=Labeo rohita TaxID=84645 RepID=A0ABQ8MP91_LABRO|nr:Matrin-3 [Labeo rohita]